MRIIDTTDALRDLCEGLRDAECITVDTEFMRESTFWPLLCLVQIASPGDDGAIIDPLADGIELGPLFDLMYDENVLKVFHAARQDIEIFVNLGGKVPMPIFDTQIAAMVCGFGDSIAYDNLVTRLTGARIDKSSRFTDWSRRPLMDKQLNYALADVTHLREVYLKLKQNLANSGRTHWLDGEMDILTATGTYITEPDEAWRRVKTRNNKPRFLGVLQTVAAWREREATRRNIPRNRILRDEALQEIAADPPANAARLQRVRGFNKKMAEGVVGQNILKAVEAALAKPESEWPRVTRPEPLQPHLQPVVELLKVLLKRKAAENDVAQKLICNTAELERIAADSEADVPALKGWRREVFGDDALRLKRGELGLAVRGGRIVEIDLS